jgi:hypothetical protein
MRAGTGNPDADDFAGGPTPRDGGLGATTGSARDRAPNPQEHRTMAQLIKIGGWFINLDHVRSVQDLIPSARQNRLTLRFSDNPDAAITLADQEADNVRTWLNSVVNDLSHLHLDTPET